MLQVKQRTRLFSKTTCSYSCVTSWQYSFYNIIAIGYSCVTSWQYSFYNTIARLIHIVFKFAIVSCTCIVAAIATFYKLHSFYNTIARAYH